LDSHSGCRGFQHPSALRQRDGGTWITLQPGSCLRRSGGRGVSFDTLDLNLSVTEGLSRSRLRDNAEFHCSRAARIEVEAGRGLRMM
jgi:hypothetical protein